MLSWCQGQSEKYESLCIMMAEREKYSFIRKDVWLIMEMFSS